MSYTRFKFILMHAHTHTYTRTHTCTSTCIHTRIDIHTRTHTHTYTHTHIHTYTHTHTRTRFDTIWFVLLLSSYTHAYTHKHTHSLSHTHTHTHTHPHTYTYTRTCTNTHTLFFSHTHTHYTLPMQRSLQPASTRSTQVSKRKLDICSKCLTIRHRANDQAVWLGVPNSSTYLLLKLHAQTTPQIPCAHTLRLCASITHCCMRSELPFPRYAVKKKNYVIGIQGFINAK